MKGDLTTGYADFKAALEIHVGDLVEYKLWVPPVHEVRGPVKVLEIKREGTRITHVKLADSPCWVPIASLLR